MPTINTALLSKLAILEIVDFSNLTMDYIKRQYRALALKTHPDKPGGDAEKFKIIDSAYKQLTSVQDIETQLRLLRQSYLNTHEVQGLVPAAVFNAYFSIPSKSKTMENLVSLLYKKTPLNDSEILSINKYVDDLTPLKYVNLEASLQLMLQVNQAIPEPNKFKLMSRIMKQIVSLVVYGKGEVDANETIKRALQLLHKVNPSEFENYIRTTLPAQNSEDMQLPFYQILSTTLKETDLLPKPPHPEPLQAPALPDIIQRTYFGKKGRTYSTEMGELIDLLYRNTSFNSTTIPLIKKNLDTLVSKEFRNYEASSQLMKQIQLVIPEPDKFEIMAEVFNKQIGLATFIVIDTLKLEEALQLLYDTNASKFTTLIRSKLDDPTMQGSALIHVLSKALESKKLLTVPLQPSAQKNASSSATQNAREQMQGLRHDFEEKESTDYKPPQRKL